MSLLKITTTPIEYEIKIERAKLQIKEQELKNAEIKQAVQQNQAKCIRNSTQTQALNESTKNSSDFQNAARQRAAGQIKPNPQNNIATSNNDIILNSIQQSDTSISNVQYNNSALIDNDYDFELQNDAIISSFELNLSSNDEWNNTKNEIEFVPGRFHMEITQLPKVSIEYTGGFHYVPKSADPNYEPQEQ